MDIIGLLKDTVALNTLFQCFAILVVFDVITGCTKAWKNGSLKSRTLRNGMFASVGEVMFLVLCIAVTHYIKVSHWLIFSIMVGMCLKELASILENLVEIGVEHIPTWLVKGLAAYNDKLDKGDE